MNADAFGALFPTSLAGPIEVLTPAARLASGPTALSIEQTLGLVRQLAPTLARRADLEAKRTSLSKRPASWALVAVTLIGLGAEDSQSVSEQYTELYERLAFPCIPTNRQARHYLSLALDSPALREGPLNALVAVLPDIVRSGQLPGSHLNTERRRQRLQTGRAAPRPPARKRRP